MFSYRRPGRVLHFTLGATLLLAFVHSPRLMRAASSLAIDPSYQPAVVTPPTWETTSFSVRVATGFPGGRFLLAGEFTRVNNQLLGGRAMFGADGAIVPGNPIPPVPPEKILRVLLDGRMYVWNSGPDPDAGIRLERLNTDFSVDAGFNVSFGPASAPSSVWPLADGRLLIDGGIVSVNGVNTGWIVRLNADGSVDTNFATTRAAVRVLEPEPDGGALIYDYYAFSPQIGVRRLLADGSDDAAFSVVALQDPAGAIRREDGSYLVYGAFTTVNGESRRGYARVLANGTLASDYPGLPAGCEFVAGRVMPDGSLRIIARQGTGTTTTWLLATVPAQSDALTFVTFSVNRFGFDPWVNGFVQDDGRAVLYGSVLAVNGHRCAHIARVNLDGTFDASFVGSLEYAGYIESMAVAPGGRIAALGTFGFNSDGTNREIALIDPDGGIDPLFRPNLAGFEGVPEVGALSDGSVLVGGRWSAAVIGGSIPALRRFRADGSRDLDFDDRFPGVSTGFKQTRDGRLLVIGRDRDDPRPGGTRLTRLNHDLTVDLGFDVQVDNASMLVPLPRGRVIIVGDVTDGKGLTRSGLVRLNADGVIDETFNPPAGLSFWTAAEAPDGKLVVAGDFTAVAGVPRLLIARLNANGSLDQSFVPPDHLIPFGTSRIDAVATEPDGGVIVTGFYLTPSLDPATLVMRLHPDGSIDPTWYHPFGGYAFNPEGREMMVTVPNGDLYVGGSFSVLDGPRTSLVRFTSHAFEVNAVRSNVRVPEGDSTVLNVRVTGADAPAFQWFHDGVEIAGADRAGLALINVDASAAGIYEAEVTSGTAVVRSDPITVELSSATEVLLVAPLNFAGSGGIGGVTVSAPAATNWTVASLPAWVRANASSGSGSRTLTLTLSPNATGTSRSAEIMVADHTLTVTQTAASGRLANISSRGRVGTGDDLMIVGLVTRGSSPLDVLCRGVGPSLAPLGVNAVLPDPVLTLFANGVETGGNDDWGDDGARDAVLTAGRFVGAFDLEDGSTDAALLAALEPGRYTAHLLDSNGDTGVALAELYDRTTSGAATPENRVVNISTRARVGAGEDVLIAGFVVTGPEPKQVLIRGVGSGLLNYDVTDVLADPVIRVVQDGRTVLENDDWSLSPDAAFVASASAAVGAFPLAADSRDAALVARLPAGSYTVLLSGRDGSAGVGLVEVYDLE